MNWCSDNVFNGYGNHIKNITNNMLYYLHNKINIFSENKHNKYMEKYLYHV